VQEISFGPPKYNFQDMVNSHFLLIKQFFLVIHSHIIITRAPAAENLILVSESNDPEFGTVVLPDAPENTERGHCQKTEAIIKYFFKNADNKKWYDL